MGATWLEVLLILVTYCGGNTAPKVFEAEKCRLERLACVKRASDQLPKENAENLVNMCLTNPDLFGKGLAPKKESKK